MKAVGGPLRPKSPFFGFDHLLASLVTGPTLRIWQTAPRRLVRRMLAIGASLASREHSGQRSHLLIRMLRLKSRGRSSQNILLRPLSKASVTRVGYATALDQIYETRCVRRGAVRPPTEAASPLEPKIRRAA